MTNYEKIKYLLEMWVYKGVEVKAIEDSFIIFWITENWNIRTDNWYIVTEELEKLNITSINPIPNPPKPLPVGTNVRVFEERNNIQGKFNKASVDSTYVIMSSSIYNSSYDISRDFVLSGGFVKMKSNVMNIPARAVYPVWED